MERRLTKKRRESRLFLFELGSGGIDLGGSRVDLGLDRLALVRFLITEKKNLHHQRAVEENGNREAEEGDSVVDFFEGREDSRD